jgi:hypothetical protein
MSLGDFLGDQCERNPLFPCHPFCERRPSSFPVLKAHSTIYKRGKMMESLVSPAWEDGDRWLRAILLGNGNGIAMQNPGRCTDTL